VHAVPSLPHRFHDVTSYGEHRALNYWSRPPE
jgi:hypothetical protein